MSRRRVQAVAALAAVGVSGYSSIAIPVLARSLEMELGLAPGALGVLLALGMAGGCVGGLAAGWLADRVDPLRSLRLSTSVCAIGCAVVAAGGFRHALLWPGLAVVGLGSGGAYVAAGGLLASLFPLRRRGSFSGLMVTNAACGIGFPIAVALLDARWRQGALGFAWVLAGPYAAAATFLAAVATALRGAPAAHPAAEEGRGGEARSRREPLVVALIVALATIHGAADGVLYTWMPRFLAERFPQGPFPPGWVLSFYSAAYLVGRLTLTFLPDRLGRRALVVAPGLIAGPLVLVALRAPDMRLTAAGYALASLLYGLEFPALMGLVSQRYPARFSMIFGWVSGMAVVAALGVWGVGRWTEATAAMAPALSVAACGFLAFGLIAAAWMARDRRTPAEGAPTP